MTVKHQGKNHLRQNRQMQQRNRKEQSGQKIGMKKQTHTVKAKVGKNPNINSTKSTS